MGIDEHNSCGGGFLVSAVFKYSGSLYGGLFFMNYLKMIWHYKYILIILFCTFFLSAYFITEQVYNANYATYSYQFEAEEETALKITDKAYYDIVFETIEENNKLAEGDSTYKKISYANIDYASMLKAAQLEQKDGYYEFFVPKRFFPNLASSSTGRINTSENRVKNYFNLVMSYSSKEVSFITVELTGNQNPWAIGGIASSVCIVLFLAVLFFYSYFNKKKDIGIEIKGENTISIFQKKYWKESLGFMHSVKKMCIISVLFGCMLICKLIPIPSGFGGLGLGFTYLFFSIICFIYGPVCGLFIGFCSDILGYFIQPGGIFFPGYTLDAMLAGFIYGLCFYKKRITFANCLVARTLVNLFVNVGLGSLWWKILYQLDWDAYITYVSLTSLPKNILYLLPQSLLLYFVFKAVCKPLAAFDLIPKNISESVNLF